MGRNLYCIGHYSARLARDVERRWPAAGRLVWVRAHPVVLSVYSDHQNTGCDARPRMLAAKVACCCGADAEQTGTMTLGDFTAYIRSVFRVMFETQPDLAERMGPISADDLAEVTAQ